MFKIVAELRMEPMHFDAHESCIACDWCQLLLQSGALAISVTSLGSVPRWWWYVMNHFRRANEGCTLWLLRSAERGCGLHARNRHFQRYETCDLDGLLARGMPYILRSVRAILVRHVPSTHVIVRSSALELSKFLGQRRSLGTNDDLTLFKYKHDLKP